MGIASGAIDWWRRFRIGSARIDEIEIYESRGDLPERIPRHQLAVLGSKSNPKWLVIECPCGYGHRIDVNLGDARKARWKLDFEHGNLRPSIDSVRDGRRCHFWIQDGKVDWCRDSTGSRSRLR